MFAERLMYAADGVMVVTVNGHTIAGCAASTFVLMTTVCVEIATLGVLIVMFTRPAGVVSKAAVEHGSLIMMLKFAVIVCPSTVAVRTSAYVLWFELVAPLIRTLPPDDVGLGKLKNAKVGLKVKVTVFPHAGVCVVAKEKLEGCVSIPTCKVVEAGGAVEKVKVWTSQVIVTTKFFVIDRTPE